MIDPMMAGGGVVAIHALPLIVAAGSFDMVEEKQPKAVHAVKYCSAAVPLRGFNRDYDRF